MVLATGVRYRRLDVENLDVFEASSVHYWASPLEAKLCANQEVALVGAGNSAGQAAVYLASQGVKVWMLARRSDLSATMSSYLVDRIRGLANVEVVTDATISGLEGRENMLEAVRWQISATGQEVRRAIKHLFLFIGAEPNTDWLSGSGIALDPKGFILTGSRCRRRPPSVGDDAKRRLRNRRCARKIGETRRCGGRRGRTSGGSACTPSWPAPNLISLALCSAKPKPLKLMAIINSLKLYLVLTRSGLRHLI